jgi:putative endonuclease
MPADPVHASAMARNLPRKHLHLEQGVASEQLAARYLESRGLIVVARNQRCKLGEIDLICLDARTLVIVEVRQRRSEQFGGALASVTHWKRRKLIRATQCYLQRASEWSHLPVRFDVIAVNGIPGRNPDIIWVKSAFTA